MCMERKARIMETIQGNVEQFTNGLELLFSLELHYQGPIELAPIGDKVGTLVGGGDGTLTGPRMRGTVRWSNYETTGEDQVCALQVPGVIQTPTAAEMRLQRPHLSLPFDHFPAPADLTPGRNGPGQFSQPQYRPGLHPCGRLLRGGAVVGSLVLVWPGAGET